MMPDADGKTESIKHDPGDLARVLELELLEKRAAWQRSNARHRTLRTISILFLFVIVLGSLAAFFFLFSHLSGVPLPKH